MPAKELTKNCRIWGMVTLAAVFAFGVFGCAENSVQKETELGEWSHSPSNPRVISGNPSADAAAYGETEQQLTEADWRRLEQLAPRPIWEQLAEAREEVKGEDKQDEAAKDRGSSDGEEPQSESEPALRLEPGQTGNETETEISSLPRDIPVLPQPDGRVKIFYELRHYGGVRVNSQYKGGTDRRSVSLDEADLAPVVSLVSEQLGDNGSASALVERNTIVVTCDEDMKEGVIECLNMIDQPNKQAEITARIFEVRSDFDFQVGVESVLKHLSSDQEQSLVTTLNPARFLESLGGGAGGFQGSVLRLMKVFESAGVTLDATFQALVNEGLINVVASPRMTVASGETAYMLAGREIPIQSGRISGDNFVTEEVTYKPVGVQLYITPRAVSGDVVKMHMITIVSTVEGFSPRRSVNSLQEAEPLVNPVINSREAETSVTVNDGDTLVIGGLRMIRRITREEKTPGLGDIPALGWMFKKHRSQRELSDLYFFVTPRLVSR
ncbi:MAG: type II secretion system protein GspD [Phycisphaerae bacterium]